MFYTHVILSKRGPLSRVWLAAHWDKKLSKASILEIDIFSSIEAILKPKLKLSMRTSGYLLLGIAKIHSRKIKYLLADCNDAVMSIISTQRVVNESETEKRKESNDNLITLPEFYEFDSIIPENRDLSFENLAFNTNQTAPELITLKENYHFKNGRDRFHDDFGSEDPASIYSLIYNSVTEDEPIGVPMKSGISFERIGGNLTEFSNHDGELNKLIDMTAAQKAVESSLHNFSYHVPELDESVNTVVAEPLSANPLIGDISSQILEPDRLWVDDKKARDLVSKKRKVLVDVVKGLTSEAMKTQMKQVMATETFKVSSAKRMKGKGDELLSATWPNLINISVANQIGTMLSQNYRYNPTWEDFLHGEKTGGYSIEKTRFQKSLEDEVVLDNLSSASKRLCDIGGLKSMESSVAEHYNPGNLALEELSVPDPAFLMESERRDDFEFDEIGGDLLLKTPRSGSFQSNGNVGSLITLIRSQFSEGSTTFVRLSVGDNRKKAAVKFYCLLVLAKHNFVEVEQDDNLGVINIKPGSNFS